MPRLLPPPPAASFPSMAWPLATQLCCPVLAACYLMHSTVIQVQCMAWHGTLRLPRYGPRPLDSSGGGGVATRTPTRIVSASPHKYCRSGRRSSAMDATLARPLRCRRQQHERSHRRCLATPAPTSMQHAHAVPGAACAAQAAGVPAGCLAANASVPPDQLSCCGVKVTAARRRTPGAGSAGCGPGTVPGKGGAARERPGCPHQGCPPRRRQPQAAHCGVHLAGAMQPWESQARPPAHKPTALVHNCNESNQSIGVGDCPPQTRTWPPPPAPQQPRRAPYCSRDRLVRVGGAHRVE